MAQLSGRLNYLDGSVELHGDWNGKDWVAQVLLADFIRMAVRQL